MSYTVYLAGGMEHANNGNIWRKEATKLLSSHNINSWDPYIQECEYFSDKSVHDKIKSLDKEKDFNKVHHIMRKIILLDFQVVLNEVDALLVCYNLSVFSGAGTQAEMSIATYVGKPVHVWLDGLGIKDIPLWILGCTTSVSTSLLGTIDNVLRDQK